MSESLTTLISAAATRAARRPAYLAWIFEKYSASEGTTAGELAASLEVSEPDLSRLALCLRPRAENFGTDIEAIAERWNANPRVLAQIVRRVEVLQGMTATKKLTLLGQRRVPERGLLMAARAREKSKSNKQEEK